MKRAVGEVVLEVRDGEVWLVEPELVTTLKDLSELFDEPDLATLGTTHVLASPPTAYVLRGSGTLGLDDVTAGDYALTWVDLDTGTATTDERTLDGGEETFDAPHANALLVLKRVGR